MSPVNKLFFEFTHPFLDTATYTRCLEEQFAMKLLNAS